MWLILRKCNSVFGILTFPICLCLLSFPSVCPSLLIRDHVDVLPPVFYALGTCRLGTRHLEP